MHWVTIEKAAEQTGLPASFFHERTGASGEWPEGRVWKWFDGRKLVDLDALYDLIAKRPSIPSKRGRKPRQTQCQEEHQPA
ncbi:hypothetical protein [Variovorax sp. JS1663]|uniref:hypothetical protein n=1 Tax=Variovorax sp. JS1663 TaxID=1851577 RepID=UPI000B346991|nr:hypothetical protein [Variovorax sp. JS1663]OUM01634.1 hypothetical protein A8M77_15285 [Variovorax sp. JS1663]